MKSNIYRIITVASIFLTLSIIIALNKYETDIKPVVDISKDWTIQYGDKRFVDDFSYNSDSKIGVEKSITLTNKFIIPEANKSTDLYLKLGKTNGSYKLYVNDVFLGEAGDMPPNFRSGWNNLGFFMLPDIAVDKNRENTIRLEYYSDYASGFISKPMIINYRDAARLFSISMFYNHTIYIIIMTLLAAVSLFFLYIYKSSIKEKYILYFSLITANLFIYYNSYVWTLAFARDFQMLKITESALFIAIILFIYFIKSYLGININKFDRILHRGQMSLVVCSLFISSIGMYNQFRDIFHIIIVFDICYIIFIAARAVIDKVPNSKYIFVITLTALMFIIHDSINFIIPSTRRYTLLFNFPISVFILPVVIMNLALTFALKIEELQNSSLQYSDKLKNLNHMLKEIIDENNVLYSKTITDYLTGTYNRNFLEISYKKQMEDMKEEDSYALFFIDIDNFRDFNNNYGHEVGDFILKSFVNCINEELDPIDIFVRYSGDEFAILMYDNEPLKHKIVAERILRSFETSKFEYKEKSYSISCSIGIKLIKSNTLSLDNALKFADMAMYRAKANGKSSYHILE